MSDTFSTSPIAELLTTLDDVQEVAFLWTPDNDELVWVSDDVSAVLREKALGDCHTGLELRQLYETGDLKKRDDWLTDNNQACVFVGRHRVGTPEQGQWFQEHLIRLEGTAEEKSKYLGLLCNISEQGSELGELTGCLSRNGLGLALHKKLNAEQSVGYGLICLDNISGINSAFGHEIADAALMTVAKTIAEYMQPDEPLGRVSRSRFGVVFPDTTPEKMAVRLSEIQASIRDSYFETAAGPVAVTASASCIMVSDHARTVQHAFSAAEEALTQAKGSGANQVVIYSPDKDIEERRRSNIELSNDLTSAMREDRLRLAYQPVVDANDPQRVAFHECLLRLIDRSGNIISAGVFMPVAEQIGFVRMLDKRVLEMAFDTLRNHDRVRLSVNLSPQSLRDSGWLALFDKLADANPNALERLILEVTEQTAIQDIESMSATLNRLRDRGCAIALDDFGAGYTSFQQFKSLKLDIVKIDGSFIRGVLDSKESQLFVRALSELAKNFELMVIAEMVENGEAGDLLREMGIDGFQSFYFGTPEMEPGWLNGGDAERITPHHDESNAAQPSRASI